MTRSEVTYQYLSDRIKSLLLFRPYYGYTLSRLERKIEYGGSVEEAGTISVSAQEMLIRVNADYFARTADPVYHEESMEHEVCHIALRHWERFQLIWDDPATTDTERHIVNVAADVAIWEIIGGMPGLGGFTRSTRPAVEKAFKVELDPKMSAEWYYRKLMETDTAKDNINDEKAFVSALSAISEEDWKSMLRDMMGTHKECFKNSKSRPMPSRLRAIMAEGARRQRELDRRRGVGKGESILNFLPEEVDQYDRDIWRKLIDKNLGDELMADVDLMWGRPSRRREDSMWWNRHQTRARTLYVGFDTSASVVCGDDRMVSRLLGYLSRGLRTNSCEATLILCDDGIQEIRKMRSVSMGKEFKIMGAGGTDLTKILDHIEKKDKNPKMARLILFTDGITPWRWSPVRTSVVYTPDHLKLEGNIMSWAAMEPTLEF